MFSPTNMISAAEVVRLHRGAGAREAVAAQAVVVDALLPVGRGLAVQPARVRVVRPLDERGVELVVPRGRALGAVADAHVVFLPTWIVKGSDSLDLDLHRVAGLQEDGRVAESADAPGRSGEDQVARLERAGVRQEAHDLGDPEDHLGRRRVLHGLAVDAGEQALVLRVAELVGCDDHGADRAEGVEALSAHPLLIRELEVAGADVVRGGVAEDGVERLRLAHRLDRGGRSRRPARPPSPPGRSGPPAIRSARRGRSGTS